MLNCAKMKTILKPLLFIVFSIPFFGLGQYCSPTYGVDVEPITLVQIQSINNSTVNTCATGLALENFTAQQTTLNEV